MIEPTLRVSVLSAEQIGRIHQAAMAVLAETGCEVRHDAALSMLAAAGARVDGSRVRIGEELVDRAVGSAPSSITLGTREGRPALELAGGRVHFGTGSDCLYVLDGDTGRRRAVLADVRRFARLADKLDEIDFVMSMACPSDVPAERLYREQFAAMLLATAKPKVFTVIDPAELGPILDMSVAAQGGPDAHRAAPHLVLYAEPISPLVHPAASVEKLLFCAAHHVPVTYSPGSMGGGTAPVTGAGSIVQSVAEVLSGLVLHQLAGPGAPFIFGGAIGPLDMTTMVNVYAAPLAPLWGAGLVEMGRHYGLPTWSTAGCSDSKLVDGQACIDAAMTTLPAVLNGANLVHDVGYIESGKTASLEMVVISAEVIAIAARMAAGLRTDAADLAVEAIRRVGPGGNFLTDDHTLEHFRREMFAPALLDCSALAAWQAAGATTLLDRAKARVAALLAEPPDQLDPARRDRILACRDRP